MGAAFNAVREAILESSMKVEGQFLLREIQKQDTELVDLRAQIAAMQAALAEIPHARGCKSNECRTCRMSIWNHFTDARWCSYSPTHTVFSPFACDCHLATLSDSIARGRELLDALKDKERMDWWSERPWLEYGIDGEENPIRWIIYRVAGGINDRQWEEIASGETLRVAIDKSMRAELAKLKGESK